MVIDGIVNVVPRRSNPSKMIEFSIYVIFPTSQNKKKHLSSQCVCVLLRNCIERIAWKFCRVWCKLATKSKKQKVIKNTITQ